MNTERRFPVWFWVVAPAVFVIALVILFELLREQRTDELPAAGITLEEIAENPSRFFGETATVRGTVAQILGARSFLITQRLESDLLVVSSVPLREVGEESGGGTFSEKSQVWATGEVWRFDLAAAEDRIGADLDQETLDAYVGTPSIVADSVSLEPPKE